MSQYTITVNLNEAIKKRFLNRRRIAISDQMDYVHRKLILEQPVLTNNMYRALINNELNSKEVEYFFSEYYYGSTGNFLRKVMPLALKSYNNSFWVNYIKEIRAEECKPKAHVLLLEDFFASVKLPIMRPQMPSERFTENSKIGYTKNLSFSCGYALAVEVEADYQIYIISEFVKKRYGQYVIDNNIWFDVHLNPDGEEEHANMSILLAENCIKTEEDFEQFSFGFLQSCKDTENFMNDIYNSC